MKKLSIFCAFLFAIGMMASSAFGQQGCALNEDCIEEYVVTTMNALTMFRWFQLTLSLGLAQVH
jgi:hypothetical protein